MLRRSCCRSRTWSWLQGEGPQSDGGLGRTQCFLCTAFFRVTLIPWSFMVMHSRLQECCRFPASH